MEIDWSEIERQFRKDQISYEGEDSTSGYFIWLPIDRIPENIEYPPHFSHYGLPSPRVVKLLDSMMLLFCFHNYTDLIERVSEAIQPLMFSNPNMAHVEKVSSLERSIGQADLAINELMKIKKELYKAVEFLSNKGSGANM